MFLGHFGLGFAGKRRAPSLSLGRSFLAVQWADLLFWILCLAGRRALPDRAGRDRDDAHGLLRLSLEPRPRAPPGLGPRPRSGPLRSSAAGGRPRSSSASASSATGFSTPSFTVRTCRSFRRTVRRSRALGLLAADGRGRGARLRPRALGLSAVHVAVDRIGTWASGPSWFSSSRPGSPASPEARRRTSASSRGRASRCGCSSPGATGSTGIGLSWHPRGGSGMRRPALAVLIALLAATADFAPAAEPPALGELSWFTGRWIDDSGGNLSEEMWSAPVGRLDAGDVALRRRWEGSHLRDSDDHVGRRRHRDASAPLRSAARRAGGQGHARRAQAGLLERAPGGVRRRRGRRIRS